MKHQRPRIFVGGDDSDDSDGDMVVVMVARVMGHGGHSFSTACCPPIFFLPSSPGND